MNGKRTLPSTSGNSAHPRRPRLPIPRRGRVAIGLLSLALAVCVGLLATLGSLYLTQLRRNQFSKNVVFSQNYSLRNALLDGGEESRSEAPAADFSLLESDPYVVLDTFSYHLSRLAGLQTRQDSQADFSPLEGLLSYLWQDPDAVSLVYDFLVSLALGVNPLDGYRIGDGAPLSEVSAGAVPAPAAEAGYAAALENCAGYLCAYYAVDPGLADTVAAALSLTAGVAGVEVEAVCQLPDYPNGCESASTVSLLRTAGFDLTLKQFVDEYLPKQDVRITFGCCYGPDPQQYYAGNPDAGQGGWGCFAPVIVRAMQAALPEHSGYTVCNLSGAELGELTMYLSLGVPVAVWTTTDGKAANEFYQWQSYDQTQTYLYPKNQHCVVLCGACPDPETGGTVYRYMDPLTGEVERMDSQQFAQCYDSMGCQAVALLPDALAQCIRCG